MLSFPTFSHREIRLNEQQPAGQQRIWKKKKKFFTTLLELLFLGDRSDITLAEKFSEDVFLLSYSVDF